LWEVLSQSNGRGEIRRLTDSESMKNTMVADSVPAIFRLGFRTYRSSSRSFFTGKETEREREREREREKISVRRNRRL